MDMEPLIVGEAVCVKNSKYKCLCKRMIFELLQWSFIKKFVMHTDDFRAFILNNSQNCGIIFI